MSLIPNAKPNHIWTYPESEEGEPSLVRLTPDMLSLAVIPKQDLEKTAAALEKGDTVAARDIPVTLITQLQAETGGNELIVTYKQSESKADSVTITLADETKRNELLGVLTDYLGTDWQREERRASRLSQGLWPLGATAAVALLTWVMHGEALRIAAGEHLKTPNGSAKRRLVSYVMHWVEGLIGPTGILVLGGLLGAVCLGWFVLAVTRPPLQITIRPRPVPATTAQ
jgi:hypothetical protein